MLYFRQTGAFVSRFRRFSMADAMFRKPESPSPSGKEPGKAGMTRYELLLLEQREKTPARQALDAFLLFCPLLACLAALGEYLLIPDRFENPHPERYVILLAVPAALYALRLIAAGLRYRAGDRQMYWTILHRAPRYTAIYLLLAVFDYATLKTGALLYPFIPWVNDIINGALGDLPNLLISTAYSLRLLAVGYFAGVAAGLLTGISAGCSSHIRYWVTPIVKVLGPIPPVVWIPLVMIILPSLFSGSVFIIALGTWFPVTMNTLTGILGIDESYFDAARLLGASSRQLIVHVAVPHALPNILQGMTQGMSTACITLMTAEMTGVKAGLGWYVTWYKNWAAYNRMFAAIIMLCIIFNAVSKGLDLIRRRALRWQAEGGKAK